MALAFTKIPKDPNSTLDYEVDWSEWLEPLSGDAINAVHWTIPSGISQPIDPPASFSDTTATVWLTGGTVGVSYNITCEITTNQGRVEDHSFTLVCQDK